MNHAPTIKVTHEILGRKKSIISSSKFNAEVEIKVSDKKGKEVRKESVPFKSFVSNFSKILQYALLGADEGVIDTDGATLAAGTHTFEVTETTLAGAASSVYGIWIGDTQDKSSLSLNATSGIQDSLNFNDFALRRKILNDGNSPDTNVVYGSTSVSMPNSNTLEVKRRFTNNNSSSIYIDEVGLVGKQSTNEFLLARDGFYDASNNPFEVPSNYIIDITYRFSLTNSSGYVDNFLRYLSGEFKGTFPVESMRDVNNTSYSYNASTLAASKSVLGPLANDDYGLLVGGKKGTPPTGLVLVKTSNTEIQNQIGETDLAHSLVSSVAMVQEDAHSTFGIKRDFENVSDENIYVDSVHLVAKISNISADPKNFLLSKVAITGVGADYVTVAPGEILRLNYYLSFPLGQMNPASTQ